MAARDGDPELSQGDIMSPPSVALVALMGIGALGLVGYALLVRAQITPPASAASAPTPPRTEARAQQAISLAASTTSAPQIPDSDTVARWIGDATGDEPNARAAAIIALAGAPPSQALPVLKAVLNAGEPLVDGPLALQSLRAIALDTGDADESIRNILRQAIYHGDNEAVVQETQTTLDDIEGYLDQSAMRAQSDASASEAPTGAGS
jgi:hypothetical protein